MSSPAPNCSLIRIDNNKKVQTTLNFICEYPNFASFNSSSNGSRSNCEESDDDNEVSPLLTILNRRAEAARKSLLSKMSNSKPQMEYSAPQKTGILRIESHQNNPNKEKVALELTINEFETQIETADVNSDQNNPDKDANQSNCVAMDNQNKETSPKPTPNCVLIKLLPRKEKQGSSLTSPETFKPQEHSAKELPVKNKSSIENIKLKSHCNRRGVESSKLVKSKHSPMSQPSQSSPSLKTISNSKKIISKINSANSISKKLMITLPDSKNNPRDSNETPTDSNKTPRDYNNTSTNSKKTHTYSKKTSTDSKKKTCSESKLKSTGSKQTCTDYKQMSTVYKQMSTAPKQKPIDVELNLEVFDKYLTNCQQSKENSNPTFTDSSKQKVKNSEQISTDFKKKLKEKKTTSTDQNKNLKDEFKTPACSKRTWMDCNNTLTGSKRFSAESNKNLPQSKIFLLESKEGNRLSPLKRESSESNYMAIKTKRNKTSEKSLKVIPIPKENPSNTVQNSNVSAMNQGEWMPNYRTCKLCMAQFETEDLFTQHFNLVHLPGGIYK